MDGHPFRFRGIEVAECRDRLSTLARVRSELVDNHVSVVGPRHIGKTVLLHQLSKTLPGGNAKFSATLLWNLKERNFESDGDFLNEFRVRLIDPVRKVDESVVAELQRTDQSAFDSILAVFEWLQEAGKCVVVCLDGFDALPVGTILSATLLENLRSLAGVKCTKSIRFLIASRMPLRDHCVSAETRNSPFHNIFPDPVNLLAFAKADIDQFLSTFRSAGITIEKGADTELFNWSGGFPLLLSILSQRLWNRLNIGDSITAAVVHDEGSKLIADSTGYLQELWRDCSSEQQAMLVSIGSGGSSEFNPAMLRHARPLVDRGFVVRDGSTLRMQCRAIEGVAKGELGIQSSLVSSLFGTDKQYAENVKLLLKQRLSQRQVFDAHLANLAEKLLDSFENPKLALALFREVARHLYSLVWARLVPDRKIPQEWTDHWLNLAQSGERGVNPFTGLLPNDGRQCRLLDQLTGDFRPKDCCIKNSTALLLDTLWSIGNYGQHRGTEDVSPTFFACSFFTVLEAWSQLEQDLGR